MWCLPGREFVTTLSYAGEGVGDNSILCEEGLKWVHKRCGCISGKLKSNIEFHCRRC